MKRRVIAVLLSLSVAVTAVPAMGSAVDAGEVPVVEAAEVVTPEEALAEEAPVVEEAADIVDADAAVVEDTAEVTEEPAAEVETIAADFTDGLSDAEVPEVAGATVPRTDADKIWIKVGTEEIQGKDAETEILGAKTTEVPYSEDPEENVASITISFGGTNSGTGTPLKEDRDYTISVTGNDSVTDAENPAVITISFIGTYNNLPTMKVGYQIIPRTLTANDVEIHYAEENDVDTANHSHHFTYNGKDQQLSGVQVQLIDGEARTTLTAGTDYELNWNSPRRDASRGRYNCTIKFKGNYTGEINSNTSDTLKYYIDKKDVEPGDITVPEHLTFEKGVKYGNSDKTVVEEYITKRVKDELSGTTEFDRSELTFEWYEITDKGTVKVDPPKIYDGTADIQEYVYYVTTNGNTKNFNPMTTVEASRMISGRVTIRRTKAEADLFEQIVAKIQGDNRLKPVYNGKDWAATIENRIKAIITESTPSGADYASKLVVSAEGQKIIDCAGNPYKITIKGVGGEDFESLSATVDVNVQPLEITKTGDFTVNVKQSPHYEGDLDNPQVTIEWTSIKTDNVVMAARKNSALLIEGTEYTYDVSTPGKVTITGVGNFKTAPLVVDVDKQTKTDLSANHKDLTVSVKSDKEYTAANGGLHLQYSTSNNITVNKENIYVYDAATGKVVPNTEYHVKDTRDETKECCNGVHNHAGQHWVTVVGTGKLAGERKVTFNIDGTEIGTDYEVQGTITSPTVFETLKKAPDASLTIKKKTGEDTLAATQYTCKYTLKADPKKVIKSEDLSSFDTAGTWVLTITPKYDNFDPAKPVNDKLSGYQGSLSVEFEVLQKSFKDRLADGDISVDKINAIAWPGNPKHEEFTEAGQKGALDKILTAAVKDAKNTKRAGNTLELGKDYTAVVDIPKTGKEAGTITFTGMGDYKTESITKTFEVTKLSLSNKTAELANSKWAWYEGGNGNFVLDPANVAVYVNKAAGNETIADPAKQYTIECSPAERSAVGTIVTVIVRATKDGDWKDSTKFQFTIKAADLRDTDVFEVTDVESQVLKEGQAIELKDLKVVDKRTGEALTAGTDYTVAYANTDKAGMGTVTLTGVGNYTGTRKENFAITEESGAEPEKTSIANADVKAYDALYDGTAKKANAVAVALGDKTLVEGTDYTVSYTDAGASSLTAKVGKKTVTVTGIGAYTGTAVSSYVVDPAQVKVTKARSGKGRARVFVEEMEGVKYQVQYRVKDTAKWKTAGTFSEVNPLVKGLKAGKKYQFHVRAVVIVDGTTIRGSWSNVKTTPYKVK